MKLVERFAQWLAPEREARLNSRVAEFQKRERDFEMLVNNRVADIVMKMDPWEPLLKKYNIVFSDEWQRPEDNLDAQSQHILFQWAYGIKNDTSFNHLINYFLNTQGNNTVRRASNDNEWFFGRAAIATLLLFREELGRLGSHYEERLTKGQTFDKNLAVE